MALRLPPILLLLPAALSLEPRGPPTPGRRAVIGSASLALTCPGLLDPTASIAADVDAERIVPVELLTSGLATAPVRDIVLTGANSGIGAVAAQLLTAAGHRVVCACRTQAKADAAATAANAFASNAQTRAGGSARGVECNLADTSSVRRFAQQLQGAPLDSLVLNAGLALNSADKVASRTADGFELTVGTNHLGHFLLANLLAPQLAKGTKPRLVVTASGVHDPTSGGGKQGSPATLGDLSGLAAGRNFEMVDGGPFDADKAYKDSKLCNMMFMFEAARRFGANGITVNAYSPGLIAIPDGFFRYQNRFFASAFNAISKAAGVAETVEFGGSGLAYLSCDAALDGVTGKFFDDFPPGQKQLVVHAASVEAQDVAKQKRLWDLSAKLTGVA